MSEPREFTVDDFRSVARVALLAAVAAGVTAGGNMLVEQLSGYDLGWWQQPIMVGLTALLKAWDRFIRDTGF